MATVRMTDEQLIVELCKIIFEQQDKIEALENELKMLKSENSTLKSDEQ